MSDVLEAIARENFRSSGYLSHPSRERRKSWTFSKPPRSPFHSNDAVRGALKRREKALHRQQRKPTFIQTCLNAFLHR
ncbi:MAG TPA: hypothetical protein DCX06_14415 [Opitutae bacterium]|nr:hypothetical protein [Opitutae bacterium]